MGNNTESVFCGNFQYQVGIEQARTNYMIILPLNILVGIAVTLLNMFVLISIFSTKRDKSPAFTLLIVLTAINLCQGVTLQPISSVNSYLMSKNKPLCRLTLADNYFSLIIGMMDILTIFMVNIQFYLAIVKPFFYKTKCNQIGYRIVLFVSWLVFGVVTIISYLYKQFRGIFIISVGISTLSIYVIMCGIFFFVSKEVNNILKKVSANNDSLYLKASLKKTRTLASSALIAYTLSVLPVAIFSLFMDVFSPEGFWMALLLKLNAVFDPIIYCMRMASIRKPIIKLIRKCFM